MRSSDTAYGRDPHRLSKSGNCARSGGSRAEHLAQGTARLPFHRVVASFSLSEVGHQLGGPPEQTKQLALQRIVRPNYLLRLQGPQCRRE